MYGKLPSIIILSLKIRWANVSGLTLAPIKGGILAILLSFALILVSIFSFAAPQLPPNFTESLIVTGINRPVTMAVAPDGRVFITEQDGSVRIVKNGVLLTTPFVTIPVDSTGERGLAGIAFDPNFLNNQYIYVFYTATTPTVHNRLSRFTANGDIAVAGSEVVLMDFEGLGGYVVHSGGTLHFGPDGKLYVSRGDSNNSNDAQSFRSLRGKLLRINSDGTIPTDNPFYNTLLGDNRAIFALGFRNPFSFDIQPGTGKIYINDVGRGSVGGQEEINEGFAGGNYGWPTCPDGPCNPPVPGLSPPVYYYKTIRGYDPVGGCAIVAGLFYHPVVAQFPSEYVGKYFYADHCNRWIRYIDPHNPISSAFATNLSGSAVVDIDIAPDGSLYYLARTSPNLGGLYRIEYTSSGPPVITFQPTDQIVSVGQTATFLISATGASPLTYQWRKAGINIIGATSSTYVITSAQTSDSGVYDCMVTNAFGTAVSNQVTLTVGSNAPPAGTIQAPASGTLFNAGDSILYSGSGLDAEDGVLPPSAFTWQVDFHHDLHTHPFIPPSSGFTGSTFTIPTTGETADNVWYRIYLTVKDSFGFSTSTYVEIFPNKSIVTLDSDPPNLQLKLDGSPVTAPFQFLGVVGIERGIEAVSPQISGGKSWQFQYWSDGGPQNHVISTPSNNNTYTANYVEGVPGPLPPPWLTQDIGLPKLAGNSSYYISNESYSVTGGGTDIRGKNDHFVYSYQPFNGNGEIVARITSVQPTDVWAKAGVMIRSSLASNAANVFVAVTPANGVTFQKRKKNGAPTRDTQYPGIVAPHWVKIVRSGRTFTAYSSTDGTEWTLVGKKRIKMPINVYAGLAVTSHNNDLLCTSTFDHVNLVSGLP